MALRIFDFLGETTAESPEDIECTFSRRDTNDSNALSFHPSETEFPTMTVLIRGNLASLNYMPSEEVAGFRSNGGVDGYPLGEQTSIFYLWPGEPQWVLNDSIVPVEVAMTAAKELLTSPALPSSVKWFEL